MKIVNVAQKYRMPVIPYAGRMSLEGHLVAILFLIFDLEILLLSF